MRLPWPWPCFPSSSTGSPRDRHTRARRAGVAPLILRVAAFVPLALGGYERLQLAAVARAAAVTPLAAHLDAWPMALASAGALAWLVGGRMAEARLTEEVRYQPTGLPSSA